tara:strand:+ start:3772 stop:4056 length:285 start_codon:yes stop_codon:yes gene_type:complete
MATELEELLKEIKAYRADMVARNYPYQQISDIITRWEMKKVETVSEKLQSELEPIYIQKERKRINKELDFLDVEKERETKLTMRQFIDLAKGKD